MKATTVKATHVELDECESFDVAAAIFEAMETLRAQNHNWQANPGPLKALYNQVKPEAFSATL